MPASPFSSQEIKRHAIAAIDLFEGMAPADIDEIARLAVLRRFEAGDTIFEEGGPCQGIWVIAEGSVRVVKTTPTGRRVLLAVQPAPSTVAEVPVFDGGPYPASVAALETTDAMLLLKNDFLRICRRNPTVTLKFLEVFGRRLRTLVNLVESVTFGSVRQRLARTLIEFADAADGITFQLPESQEELAARLGTVREVVSRNLSRFQAEGMLRLQRREIVLLDRDALEAEAETPL